MADRIRFDLRTRQPVSIDPRNQDEASDALHALVTRLSEDCAGCPELVLEEAEAIGSVVAAIRWPDDEMEERGLLSRSFAFIAWRAARILGLAYRAQGWESEYRRSFRKSLSWDVAESIFESEGGSSPAFSDVARSDAEGLFQVLLYLEDQREADPKKTSVVAEDIYQSLHGRRLPKDLHSFLLSEAARVVGGALRQISEPDHLKRWCDLAESHLENDPNPSPSLTRIAFLRLASLYEQSRYELAAAGAPPLEKSFANFGMEEDRVKCRILWAASLKLLGRFQEALEVLQPIRDCGSQIPPSLYGWILLHSGDLHQICGHYAVALQELGEAEHLLRESKQFTGLADVHSMISCVYRSHGMLREALELLKSSCDEHARLGMKALEAVNRMLIAETYLAMGLPHEAEKEIRTAIPVFEDQAMLADGVVALNLLREAIRRQEVDLQTVNTRDRFRPKK